ncbi:hypothetical protein ACIRP2_19935 [Streptomyces sp. NPDC101194]|uniref:hypothetical protein n=1 Tax=Streptomyces sp. NPDC101194 TaxID=3366127 RepID=UPI00381B0782
MTSTFHQEHFDAPLARAPGTRTPAAARRGMGFPGPEPDSADGGTAADGSGRAASHDGWSARPVSAFLPVRLLVRVSKILMNSGMSRCFLVTL